MGRDNRLLVFPSGGLGIGVKALDVQPLPPKLGIWLSPCSSSSVHIKGTANPPWHLTFAMSSAKATITKIIRILKDLSAIDVILGCVSKNIRIIFGLSIILETYIWLKSNCMINHLQRRIIFLPSSLLRLQRITRKIYCNEGLNNHFIFHRSRNCR